MKVAAIVALSVLAAANAYNLDKYIAQAQAMALKRADFAAQQYEALLSGRRSLQNLDGCLQTHAACDTSTGDINSAACQALVNCFATETFNRLDECFADYGALGAYAQCIIALTGVGTDAIGTSETINGGSLEFDPTSQTSSTPNVTSGGSATDQEFLTVIVNGGTPDSALCNAFYADTNVLTYSTLTCLYVFDGVTDVAPETPPECLFNVPGQEEPEDIFADSDESLATSDPADVTNNIGLNDTTFANLKSAIDACDAVVDIDIQGTIGDSLASSAASYTAQIVAVVGALVMAITLA